MSRVKGPRPKHVPQRTCVACRRVQGKRSLIRLVRTPAGVVVDVAGKAAGRGMYLHPNQQCWAAALKSGRIEAALRTRLTPEARRMLQEYAATLPAAEDLPGVADFGDEAPGPGADAPSAEPGAGTQEVTNSEPPAGSPL